MQINEDFSDKFELADGRVVLLRMVQPGDKRDFVDSLNICSDQTIYNRFMGSKPKFTTAELKYLTECDHRNHVGIVGFHEGELVAVGRAIRFGDRPYAADVGIIVADEYQRGGLGSYIFGLLMVSMLERAVYFLCGELFSSNSAMFHMIDELPFEVNWLLNGSVASFEIDLTSDQR